MLKLGPPRLQGYASLGRTCQVGLARIEVLWSVQGETLEYLTSAWAWLSPSGSLGGEGRTGVAAWREHWVVLSMIHLDLFEEDLDIF